MSFELVRLGPFYFGMPFHPYQKMRQSTEVRWPSNKPISSEPIYQYLGPDDDRVTLSGLVFPEWTADPYREIAHMRVAARVGAIMMFVSSLGDVFGNWVIKTVNSDSSYFNRHSVPRKFEFEITILRAGSLYRSDNRDRSPQPGIEDYINQIGNQGPNVSLPQQQSILDLYPSDI